MSNPAAAAWNALPRGRQTFGGVPFELEGRSQVTGMNAARVGDFSPPRLAGIPIGRKATRLFLLHGTDDIEKDGVPIAKLVFHYADGRERSTRIGYGVHVRSWQKARSEKKTALADPGSSVAWTARSEETERAAAGLRLFSTALENPRPNDEIRSIELVSLFSRATPVLFAITVEDVGADRPPPPAPPGSRAAMKRMNELADSVYARELKVRVTGAAGGRALSDASVHLTLTDDQSSFYFGSSRTDERGAATLLYPPQQAVSFTLHVQSPGHVPVTLPGTRVDAGEFTRDYSATLERGLSIGGLVRDQDGQPVSGVEVVVARVVQDGRKDYTQTDFDVALTDGAGKWSSAAMPSGFTGFSFQLRHPEFKPAIYSQAEGNTASERQITGTELLAGKAAMTIQRAVRVEGIVADGDGHAVTNADVYWGRGAVVQKKPALKTDDRGRFSWVAWEEGRAALAVLAPGLAPRFQSILIEPEMKPLRITMTKARPFRGQVRDTDQAPVPGATVKVETWHNSSLLAWRTQTDAEGRFTWDSAPSDNVQFLVSASNYLSMRMEMATGREGVFALRKISRVLGRVLDAETHKPIDDFKIIRGRSYSPGQPIRWERYNTTHGRHGEYSMRLDDYPNGQMQVLVEAPGYLPATSPAFSKPGWYTNDFALRKGKGVGGVVQGPDGKPAGNATVILVDTSEGAYMDQPGQFRSNGSNEDSLRTDAQGRFEFSPRFDADALLVSHEQGYAEIKVRQLAAGGRVVLAPWGNVKGVLRVGKKVEANQAIALHNSTPPYGEEGRQSPALSLYLKADPDADGNFLFEKVPPGERKIYLRYTFRQGPGMTPLSHGFPVMIKPGETTEITIGGTGRPVTGRVSVTGGDPDDVDWLRDVHALSLRVPLGMDVPPPDLSGVTTDEERQKRWQDFQERQKKFWQSEKGRALDRAQRSYVLVFATNATFRAENVPPGSYGLSIRPTDPQQEYYNNQELGSLNHEVMVPEAPAGRPDEPFDLGTLELRTKRIARVGRMAPSFSTKTFDGKPVKLEDFRGKYVLLNFWATWGGSQGSELQALKTLHETYRNDGRLAIVGLNLDNDAKIGADFAAKNEMVWTQCYLGGWSESQVPASFGVEGVPAALLLDPQGKILAKNLRESSLRSAVRNALGDPKKAPGK